MKNLRAIRSLCRRHPIAKLQLFGSRARRTAKRTSDYDLIVDFTPGSQPTLLTLGTLQSELSQILHAPVDLLANSKTISKSFLKDAGTLFERT